MDQTFTSQSTPDTGATKPRANRLGWTLGILSGLFLCLVLCGASAAFGYYELAPKLYFEVGKVNYGQQAYDQAIQAFDQAIQFDASQAEYYYWRGISYLGKQAPGFALIDLNQAIQLDPGQAVYYRDRGVAYGFQNNFIAALADLDEAVRLNPEDHQTYFWRGMVNFQADHAAEAIADFTESARLFPQNALPYFGRGQVYMSQMKCDLAVADFTEAIQRYSVNANFYAHRAMAYNCLDEPDSEKTLADANKAIELDPNNDTAYLARGLAYNRMDQNDAARADFEMVLQISSDEATRTFAQRMLGLVGSAPSATSFRDDFDGALGGGWLWKRENPSGWSLTNKAGWLEIMAGAGNVNQGDLENLLLRYAPAGNFELETKISFKPAGNYQMAGLMIYESDARHVIFGRAFCDTLQICIGDGYYFDSIAGGDYVPGNFGTPMPDTAVVYLRLRREADTYTAYASEDGSNWQTIGSHTNALKPVFVGLVAGQAVEAEPQPAQFDYFVVKPLP
jgi:tetratricopeptide (TPR) repeat protein